MLVEGSTKAPSWSSGSRSCIHNVAHNQTHTGTDTTHWLTALMCQFSGQFPWRWGHSPGYQSPLLLSIYSWRQRDRPTSWLSFRTQTTWMGRADDSRVVDLAGQYRLRSRVHNNYWASEITIGPLRVHWVRIDRWTTCFFSYDHLILFDEWQRMGLSQQT